MSHIIKFDPSKRKQNGQKKSLKSHKTPEKKPPDRDTVKLWQVAEAIDEIIKDAVLQQNLNPREVAAVLAHRLGNLIQTTESPHELLEFCEQLIERLNPKPETDPNSSAS